MRKGTQPAQSPLLPTGGGVIWGGAAIGEQEYSGIGLALLHLDHTKYNPEVIDTKLPVQLAVDSGDTITRTAFRDFDVNVQQFWVYLAMLGGQSFVTMVHTPQVYYSIRALMSVYQGKTMAFVGTDELPLCGGYHLTNTLSPTL